MLEYKYMKSRDFLYRETLTKERIGFRYINNQWALTGDNFIFRCSSDFLTAISEIEAITIILKGGI